MKKDTTDWFEREVVIANVAFPEGATAFKTSLAKHGFKIKDESSSAANLTVKAMFGSKWKAFLFSLIPYLGRHLPSGKRLFLNASITQVNIDITIRLNITPYMELFDCEEIMLFSQTPDEKISDEYLAALKLFQLIQTIFAILGREVPQEFQKLDIKPFAKDTFWRFLLYPLDGFKSRKPVFIPSESGPTWCWGGFLLPEIWFLWHEIWGASILAVIAEIIIGRFVVPEIGFHGIWVGIGIVRIAGGIFGHRIYYLRYGAWLESKPN